MDSNHDKKLFDEIDEIQSIVANNEDLFSLIEHSPEKLNSYLLYGFIRSQKISNDYMHRINLVVIFYTGLMALLTLVTAINVYYGENNPYREIALFVLTVGIMIYLGYSGYKLKQIDAMFRE